MTQHGGRRPGAGRKKGSRNKATEEQQRTLCELAQSHTETAIEVLVEIAQEGESEASRVSAANAILNRGYGTPPQSVELSGEVVKVVITEQDASVL